MSKIGPKRMQTVIHNFYTNDMLVTSWTCWVQHYQLVSFHSLLTRPLKMSSYPRAHSGGCVYFYWMMLFRALRFFFITNFLSSCSQFLPGSHSKNPGRRGEHCWLFLRTDQLAEQKPGGEGAASGLPGGLGRRGGCVR